MIFRAGLVIGTSLLIAVLLEVTFLSRLGLPGATPDLVAVTVVALGLALGPTPGAVAGFVGGVLVDVTPPSDGVLGVNALILIVIGFLAGQVIDPRDRSIWVILGIVGLSTSGAVIAGALLNAILGSDRIVWDLVPLLTLTAALYGVLLAPIVVPLIGRISRGLVPELAND